MPQYYLGGQLSGVYRKPTDEVLNQSRRLLIQIVVTYFLDYFSFYKRQIYTIGGYVEYGGISPLARYYLGANDIYPVNISSAEEPESTFNGCTVYIDDEDVMVMHGGMNPTYSVFNHLWRFDFGK